MADSTIIHIVVVTIMVAEVTQNTYGRYREFHCFVHFIVETEQARIRTFLIIYICN